MIAGGTRQLSSDSSLTVVVLEALCVSSSVIMGLKRTTRGIVGRNSVLPGNTLRSPGPVAAPWLPLPAAFPSQKHHRSGSGHRGLGAGRRRGSGRAGDVGPLPAGPLQAWVASLRPPDPHLGIRCRTLRRAAKAPGHVIPPAAFPSRRVAIPVNHHVTKSRLDRREDVHASRHRESDCCHVPGGRPGLCPPDPKIEDPQWVQSF